MVLPKEVVEVGRRTGGSTRDRVVERLQLAVHEGRSNLDFLDFVRAAGNTLMAVRI